MIDPQDARERLHRLIDQMPDEQVALVWMTFQSMFGDDYPDDETSDSDDVDQDSDEQ